jgi:hypothetical protein
MPPSLDEAEVGGMIPFPCPKCTTVLREPDDKVGHHVKCPKCGINVHVPEEQQANDDTTSASVTVLEPVTTNDDAISASVPVLQPVRANPFAFDQTDENESLTTRKSAPRAGEPLWEMAISSLLSVFGLLLKVAALFIFAIVVIKIVAVIGRQFK